MNQAIAKELEILWSDLSENEVDEKLAAFGRLNAAATKGDLQQLVDAIRSERNDFWTRELLSEPICYLGGVDYLPELFEALNKNYDEGHDNDSFCHFLMEIAWTDPEKCRAKLLELIANDQFQYKSDAEWLLEFCG